MDDIYEKFLRWCMAAGRAGCVAMFFLACWLILVGP